MQSLHDSLLFQWLERSSSVSRADNLANDSRGLFIPKLSQYFTILVRSNTRLTFVLMNRVSMFVDVMSVCHGAAMGLTLICFGAMIACRSASIGNLVLLEVGHGRVITCRRWRSTLRQVFLFESAQPAVHAAIVVIEG